MDKASIQLHITHSSHALDLVEAATEMKDLKEVDFCSSNVRKKMTTLKATESCLTNQSAISSEWQDCYSCFKSNAITSQT